MRSNPSFRNTRAALALTLGVALAAPAALAGDPVRLRVQVDDPRTGEQRVRLNVPLGSIEQILEMAHQQMDGDLDFDLDMRHAGPQARAFYLALRDEDLTDFLEVNGDGEHVKMWKDRDAFHLEVQEEGYDEPNVRMNIPLQVLDVLFLDEKELDVRGALEELRRLAPLTLLEAEQEDETIRIWLE